MRGSGTSSIPERGTRSTWWRFSGGNGSSPLDVERNSHPAPSDPTAKMGRRGRDVVALVALGVALAALWATTFYSSTGLWGEYRPATVDLQEPPPPPTILVPSLSLDEARQILEGAAGGGEGSHGGR